jgi:hypothetical protein
MTTNVFDSLLEVAERLLEKPEPVTPEPEPERPVPAGLADLSPAAREAVEPILRHFTVTNVALLLPPPPQPPRPAPQSKRRPPPEAPAVPDEVRTRAIALGWADEHLATLAALLRLGDTLGEVTAQAIEIRRRSGVVQKFYNADVEQPWLRRVETIQ